MTSETTETTPIQSVERAVKFLEYIQQQDGATLNDLDNAFECSRSTVHRYLVTLQRNRFISKHGEIYHLGLRFLDFASSARNREQIYSIAKPVVDELADETGERVAVAQEEFGRAIWLYYAESTEAVTTDAHIGIDLDLYCTAIGKAILAFSPPERTEELIASCSFNDRTENTITQEDELLSALESIRERGVAFDDEERLEGVRGIAVPIRNRSEDNLIAGLTIAGPTTRLRNDWFWEELPDTLTRAANMIEVNYNYQ